MREPNFNALVTKLLDGGIATRSAHRAVGELHDHYDDLVESAMGNGRNSRDAMQIASQRLGSLDAFVCEMLARRELKTWAFRYPRTALVVYPLACIASLPAMPILAGAAHASSVARWSAIMLLAGFVTAAMLLAMQLSIVLG
jgi:hypothetical protein